MKKISSLLTCLVILVGMAVVLPQRPAQVQGATTVSGDIFAGGSITGIAIDASSIVTAEGSISVGDSGSVVIPGYKQSAATSWEKARGIMLANIDRLKKERAKQWATGSTQLPINTSAVRRFNLNPILSSPFLDETNNTSQPEGGVWHVTGNLTITAPMAFVNLGTIIVDGNVQISGTGSVTVKGSTSLGLVALGTGGITIESGVTNIDGVAFFSANGPMTVK